MHRIISMQTVIVTFLVIFLSIYIANGNPLDAWRTGPMVFPCGPSRNQHHGGPRSMIYDCRGSSGDGQRGSGQNGGEGGTSVVETQVDANGMVYIPRINKLNW